MSTLTPIGQKPQIVKHLKIANIFYEPLLSDIYRTWYLSPGSFAKHGCFSPRVYASLLKSARPQFSGPPEPEEDS